MRKISAYIGNGEKPISAYIGAGKKGGARGDFLHLVRGHFVTQNAYLAKSKIPF